MVWDKSWQYIVDNTKSGKSIADKINNTKYDFYQDSPYNVNDYYKDIDSNVPNVKFIFVKRDSIEGKNSLRKNLKRINKYIILYIPFFRMFTIFYINFFNIMFLSNNRKIIFF